MSEVTDNVWCGCMTEDPGDGFGERVVVHSMTCPLHPEHEPGEPMMKFTAQFPLAGRAAGFAEKIAESGWSATNIVRSGRTVTFETPTPPDESPVNSPMTRFFDYLETVGYCGSDQSRKATLSVEFPDGKTLTQRAPMAY